MLTAIQLKNIVMTGGTSGIGRIAVDALRNRDDIRLHIGARCPSQGGLHLDLARLSSVRQFAEQLLAELGAQIDVLVLNAGVRLGDTRHRTEDGYETVFATNHLSQHLLLRLLMPRLAPDATIIITTSDLHDRATNPYAPPLHADAVRLAAGDTGRKEGNAMAALRAYAASKLCNVLTAKALASFATPVGMRWQVVAFNPGLTRDTQLVRDLPLAQRGLTWLLACIVSSPPERVGAILAALISGDIKPIGLQPAPTQPRFAYASISRSKLSWPSPSAVSDDAEVVEKLWNDSIRLTM